MDKVMTTERTSGAGEFEEMAKALVSIPEIQGFFLIYFFKSHGRYGWGRNALAYDLALRIGKIKVILLFKHG